MMNIKVIGFDLDQTLYPKSPDIDAAIQKQVFIRLAQIKDISIEEAKKMFSTYYPSMSGRQTLKKLGIKNAEQVIQESLEHADLSKHLKPDAKVLALLNELKQKYKLALITGSHRKTTQTKLELLKIPEQTFDCIITGEIAKSDGTAFKQWMEFHRQSNSSLQPADFLYIGDRKMTDVDAPKELGMNAILVYVKKEYEALDVPQLPSLLHVRELLLK